MYLSLSGLGDQSAEKQVYALTLHLSQETVTIVDNLGLTVDQRKDVKEIIRAIAQYVEGQINESVERCQRRQQVNEPLDNFLVSLRELSKTCNFCSEECTQKSIRNQIVKGLIEGDTVEDLLKVKNLPLMATISKCRALEAARQQREEITHTQLGNMLVHTVRRPAPQRPSNTATTCP